MSGDSPAEGHGVRASAVEGTESGSRAGLPLTIGPWLLLNLPVPTSVKWGGHSATSGQGDLTCMSPGKVSGLLHCV